MLGILLKLSIKREKGMVGAGHSCWFFLYAQADIFRIIEVNGCSNRVQLYHWLVSDLSLSHGMDTNNQPCSADCR